MAVVTTVVTKRVPHQHTITKTETDSEGHQHTTTETITVWEVVREVVRKVIGDAELKPPALDPVAELARLEEERRRLAPGFVGVDRAQDPPGFVRATEAGNVPFALDGASLPNLLFADDQTVRETIRYLLQNGADTARVFANYDGNSGSITTWADDAIRDAAGLTNDSDPARLSDPAFAAAVDAEIDFIAARLAQMPGLIDQVLAEEGLPPGSFKLVVSLADFYQSGGTIPGTSSFYSGYPDGTFMDPRWFDRRVGPDGQYVSPAFAAYKEFVDRVVGPNAENPAIAAWELGNEMQIPGAATAEQYDRFVDFFSWGAAYLKHELGAQQMVGTGVIGSRHFLNAPQGAGEIYRAIHASPDIDFASLHMYAGDLERFELAEGSGRYSADAAIARDLHKPVFLGETAVPIDPAHALEVDGVDYFADAAAAEAELGRMLDFMAREGITARAWWSWEASDRGGPTRLANEAMERRWVEALRGGP